MSQDLRREIGLKLLIVQKEADQTKQKRLLDRIPPQERPLRLRPRQTPQVVGFLSELPSEVALLLLKKTVQSDRQKQRQSDDSYR